MESAKHNGGLSEFMKSFQFYPYDNYLVFITCFSDPECYKLPFGDYSRPYENLIMWRTYGHDSKGGAIEFDKSSIEYLYCGENKLQLYPIIYNTDEQYLFVKYIANLLYDIVNEKESKAYMKLSSFSNEKLPISKLILGPNCSDKDTNLAFRNKTRITKSKLPIIIAELPYRVK
jgi:hypothetical protein